MRRTIVVAAALLPFMSMAGAQDPETLEPIFAADQRHLGFEALSQEMLQFQKLMNWYSQKAAIAKSERELLRRRRAFERAKSVGQAAARAEVERLEYLMRKGELELAELRSQASSTRVSTQITQLILQQYGEPGSDLRRPIAEKMKQSLELQLEGLQSSLAGAGVGEIYFTKRLETARELHRKKLISDVEFEEREREHLDAITTRASLEDQVKLLRHSIDGLSRSIRRLFEEPTLTEPKSTPLQSASAAAPTRTSTGG